MKLALLATLVTFAGSIAGFTAVTAGSTSVSDAPVKGSEAIVVQDTKSRDREDCPWRRAERDA